MTKVVGHVMRPVGKTEPVRVAWEAYKATEDYANTRHWAVSEDHCEGSLWAAFSRGFELATERAASLHEQIDNADDFQRLEGLPGAGAMGAIIEYRDKIRGNYD